MAKEESGEEVSPLLDHSVDENKNKNKKGERKEKKKGEGRKKVGERGGN